MVTSGSFGQPTSANAGFGGDPGGFGGTMANDRRFEAGRDPTGPGAHQLQDTREESVRQDTQMPSVCRWLSLDRILIRRILKPPGAYIYRFRASLCVQVQGQAHMAEHDGSWARAIASTGSRGSGILAMLRQ